MCYRDTPYLLSLLIYGYATGVYSSRRLQQATFDSVAFRFIAADQHPDHDTISTFRQRFLPQLQALFVQVLVLAGELTVLQLGKISLDGTKVQAHASKHSALSYGHALKQEEQLRADDSSRAGFPPPRVKPTRWESARGAGTIAHPAHIRRRLRPKLQRAAGGGRRQPAHRGP